MQQEQKSRVADENDKWAVLHNETMVTLSRIGGRLQKKHLMTYNTLFHCAYVYYKFKACFQASAP